MGSTSSSGLKPAKPRWSWVPTEDNLDQEWDAEDDFAIFVPSDTWHNIINTGDEPLKLYSIYAPPHHPHGTVHATFADAEAAEAEEHSQ
jgi:oxalate decarboxylase/phosphoglucose isomerase-like protein (cupin superfamily)